MAQNKLLSLTFGRLAMGAMLWQAWPPQRDPNKAFATTENPQLPGACLCGLNLNETSNTPRPEYELDTMPSRLARVQSATGQITDQATVCQRYWALWSAPIDRL